MALRHLTSEKLTFFSLSRYKGSKPVILAGLTVMSLVAFTRGDYTRRNDFAIRSSTDTSCPKVRVSLLRSYFDIPRWSRTLHANLVVAWQSQGPRHEWWFGASVISLVERIGTFSFFIPTALRLMRAEEFPQARVSAMARRWIALNHVRTALGISTRTFGWREWRRSERCRCRDDVQPSMGRRSFPQLPQAAQDMHSPASSISPHSPIAWNDTCPRRGSFVGKAPP